MYRYSLFLKEVFAFSITFFPKYKFYKKIIYYIAFYKKYMNNNFTFKKKIYESNILFEVE